MRLQKSDANNRFRRSQSQYDTRSFEDWVKEDPVDQLIAPPHLHQLLPALSNEMMFRGNKVSEAYEKYRIERYKRFKALTERPAPPPLKAKDPMGVFREICERTNPCVTRKQYMKNQMKHRIIEPYYEVPMRAHPMINKPPTEPHPKLKPERAYPTKRISQTPQETQKMPYEYSF